MNRPGSGTDAPETHGEESLAQAVPGWDQARAGAGAEPPASYDYTALLHYDLSIRWLALAGGAPLLAPLIEWLLFSRQDPLALGQGVLLLLGLLTLTTRSAALRLAGFVLYALGFVGQFQFWMRTGPFAPAPNGLWLAALIGAGGLLCLIAATALIGRVDRLRQPTELRGRLGRIWGSRARLRQVLLIYQTADEARANQTWIRQGGSPE